MMADAGHKELQGPPAPGVSGCVVTSREIPLPNRKDQLVKSEQRREGCRAATTKKGLEE